MSKIVGIDFSLNSTAMCVLDNNDYNFYNFINAKSFKGKKGKVLAAYNIHNQIDNFINFVFVKRDILPDDYSLNQIRKLNDYNELAFSIIERIPPGTSIVAIEGFSYSSRGRSEVDLIMAQTVLRYHLNQLKGVSIKIIPPSNIKKTLSGKGNANKILMLDSFKNIEHPINNHPLFAYSNENDLKRSLKEVYKPIDDLIDAFAIIFYLEKNKLF